MNTTAPAAQYVTAHQGDVATAVEILLAERTLTSATALNLLERTLRTTSRADFVRRVHAAFSWGLTRLPRTEAGELALQTLREILGTPEAVRILR